MVAEYNLQSKLLMIPIQKENSMEQTIVDTVPHLSLLLETSLENYFEIIEINSISVTFGDEEKTEFTLKRKQQ